LANLAFPDFRLSSETRNKKKRKSKQRIVCSKKKRKQKIFLCGATVQLEAIVLTAKAQKTCTCTLLAWELSFFFQLHNGERACEKLTRQKKIGFKEKKKK
jgi:hypothetical protein